MTASCSSFWKGDIANKMIKGALIHAIPASTADSFYSCWDGWKPDDS